MSPLSRKSTKSSELGGELLLPEPMIEGAATASSDMTIIPETQDGDAASKPATAATSATTSGQSTPQLRGRPGFRRNLSGLSSLLQMTNRDISPRSQADVTESVSTTLEQGTHKQKGENTKPSVTNISSARSTPARTGRPGFKSNLSGIFKAASKESSPTRSWSGKSSLGDTNLGAQSPELLAMLSGNTAPDLESVNRALEELSMSADSGNSIAKGQAVKSLENLASELKTARQSCKTLLKEAMQARDEDMTEVCRAMCVRIIHQKHSEVGTKIYAYNILSTLASVGQAKNFLNESTKLVRQHVKDEVEREKQMGVITHLRHSADARDAQHSKEGRRARQEEVELPGPALEEAEEAREGSGDVEMSTTPKSERILQWGTQDKK